MNIYSIIKILARKFGNPTLLNRTCQRLLHINNLLEDEIRRKQAGLEEGKLPVIYNYDQSNPLSLSVLDDKSPWSNITLEKTNIPGMITKEESQYYVYLGQFYSGQGEVIELGPWLGRSTYYILQGLLKNPCFAAKKIYVYDDFVWRSSWMNKFMPESQQLENHHDFQFLFEQFIRGFEKYLTVEKRKFCTDDGNENVPELEWIERPIEILIVDCGRTYEVNESWFRILSRFFIPNRTLIAMQDWGQHREIPVKWYNQTKQFTDSKNGQLQLLHELSHGTIATFLYRGATR